MMNKIEDRVKKLFSFWSSSSVFPPLYLAGLEGAFYMTESEFLQLQLTITQQNQQEQQNQVIFNINSQNKILDLFCVECESIYVWKNEYNS